MGNLTALARAATIACLCVYMSYAVCYDGFNDDMEGIYGQDVRLSCRAAKSLQCNRIFWRNETSMNEHTFHFVPPTDTNHTSVDVQGRTSVLHISGITLDDAGSYSCWCYRRDGIVASNICSNNLGIICQARMLVNGKPIIYNSNPSPNVRNVFNVTEYDDVRIECHEGAYLESNCSLRFDSQQCPTTVSKKVTSPCYISCISKKNTSTLHKSCIVHITVQVITSYQPTTVTLATTPFKINDVFVIVETPLLLLIALGGVVCVLFLVVVALCLCVFSPRSNKRSRNKRKSKSVKATLGTNTGVFFNNEVIDKSIDTNSSIPENSMKRELSITNTYYTVGTDTSDEPTMTNRPSMEVDALYSHNFKFEENKEKELPRNDPISVKANDDYYLVPEFLK